MIKKMISQYNHQTGHNRSIQYIVIHYVGATGGSEANAKYFGSKNVGASAHYFVGHAGEPICQVVRDEDIAWHCGTTGTYYCGCRNANSIGIELCCWQNADGTWRFDDETVDAAVDLVRNLMDTYDIDVDHVIRHYDVTHKVCPEPYVRDEAAWRAFRARLVDDTLVQKPAITGHVADVQRWLNQEYGFALDIDNSAGPLTWTALRKALQMEINRQSGAGLEIDGSIGPKTKAAILYTKRGVKGNITKLVQAALYCKGYDPNGLDGSFGPGMEAAVRKYQADHGLSVDGMAGRETQASLFR